MGRKNTLAQVAELDQTETISEAADQAEQAGARQDGQPHNGQTENGQTENGQTENGQTENGQPGNLGQQAETDDETIEVPVLEFDLKSAIDTDEVGAMLQPLAVRLPATNVADLSEKELLAELDRLGDALAPARAATKILNDLRAKAAVEAERVQKLLSAVTAFRDRIDKDCHLLLDRRNQIAERLKALETAEG